MHRSRPPRARRAALGALMMVALLGLVACGDDDDTVADADLCAPSVAAPEITPEQVADAEVAGTTVRLATHDSFAVSEETFDALERETGIRVEVLRSGDTGQLVSQSVLTAGRPVADVLFGIDNTFLCRGLAGNVFQPYRSPNLADVPEELQIDPTHHVTPIDFGDVCLNYSKAAFADREAPASLDDLRRPELAGSFVTQNPETSSPGLAFLLATIARYGEPGWEDFWRDLRANGVRITSGWTEAYVEVFGGGTGARPIVTSYASSPVVEVLFADPPVDEPPTGVVTDSCFRQIEFAGVLRGTEHPEAAARLVDFMLSRTFQEDIPLNMFVFPANATAQLPEVFVTHSTPVPEPLSLDPAEIEAGRDPWTDRWTEIVLR